MLNGRGSLLARRHQWHLNWDGYLNGHGQMYWHWHLHPERDMYWHLYHPFYVPVHKNGTVHKDHFLLGDYLDCLF